MYVRNCWYVAGWAHEFGGGKLVDRVIINEPVVVYRKLDGTLAALENRCVHRLAALSQGCLEGDEVRCLYHGFKYSPDGKCTEIPGQDSVPAAARIRSYPVVERHDWVWVWLGEAEKADPNLIPACPDLDRREWLFKTGFLDYQANYKLVNDNLTDLSHLSYVHKNSFLAGPHWILVRPTVVALERGVRVQRWVTDPKPPYMRDYPADTVDQFVEYDHLVPGVFLLHTAVYPVGTKELAAEGKPLPEPLWETYSRQAVTPMTARTTRYSFSWGPPATYGSGESADDMFEVAKMAFDEDKTVIERQQEIIDLDPAKKILATRMDTAAITFERVMNSLMLQEGSVRAA